MPTSTSEKGRVAYSCGDLYEQCREDGGEIEAGSKKAESGESLRRQALRHGFDHKDRGDSHESERLPTRLCTLAQSDPSPRKNSVEQRKPIGRPNRGPALLSHSSLGD